MKKKVLLTVSAYTVIFILLMSVWGSSYDYEEKPSTITQKFTAGSAPLPVTSNRVPEGDKGIKTSDSPIAEYDLTANYARNARAPSDWSNDTRLTFIDSYCRMPTMAVSGDIVHVVWDNRTSPYEIYYRRSLDNGRTWEPEKMLSLGESGTVCSDPKIAINGSNVHIVYEDDRSGGYIDIYYINSTDDGETWSSPTVISVVDTSNDQWPDIAVWGDNIHVVWGHEYTLGQYELYYKNSTDGGKTWSTIQTIENSAATQGDSHIAVNGDNVHMVWGAYVGNWESYYKKSTDNGITWSSNTPIGAIDGYNSDHARIAVNGSNVHVVWQDNMGFSADEIHYRNSTNNGDTWNSEINVTLDDGYFSSQPAIAINGSKIEIVWIDERDNYGFSGAYEIYYRNSTDGGIIWNSENRLTTALNNSIQPRIACTSGFTHIVWQDNRTGNYEIYYKRSPDFGNEPFTFNLNNGWNLITLPLNNTTYQRAEDLSQAIPNCTHVAKWNTTTQALVMHTKGTDENNFTIDNGTGYFVYVNNSSAFTILGGIVNSSEVILVNGWNSLGRYNFTTTDAESIGKEIENCTAVAYWDNALDRFVTHPVGTDISNFSVKRGVGYFVYIT